MKDFTVVRPDVVLHGTDTGDGRPSVLLLHAGGERRQVWSEVSRSLADHGFRSLAYDQRGHGDTEAVDAEILPPFADDVAAVVRSVPGPLTIVGSSLGGLAALLALNDPTLHESVAGLVLVDVVPDLHAGRVRASLDQTTEEIASSPLVPDILGRVEDLRRAAQALRVPTLLVRGEHGYLTDEDVDRFVGLVPHAEVSTVPGAGHLVARDAPHHLAELLIAHLGAATKAPTRYAELPGATKLEDTIAEQDQRAVADPELGRNTDRDFNLRY